MTDGVEVPLDLHGSGLLSESTESVLAAVFSDEWSNGPMDHQVAEGIMSGAVEEYVDAVIMCGLFTRKTVDVCRQLWLRRPDHLLALLTHGNRDGSSDASGG